MPPAGGDGAGAFGEPGERIGDAPVSVRAAPIPATRKGRQRQLSGATSTAPTTIAVTARPADDTGCSPETPTKSASASRSSSGSDATSISSRVRRPSSTPAASAKCPADPKSPRAASGRPAASSTQPKSAGGEVAAQSRSRTAVSAVAW